MNLDDFSYTENDRRYINPQVSLDEQNAFINNLRNNQQDWTDETISVTENLGTKIPSQLGGLTGGSGYFASRYQTPQTNSMVADLKAVAQSKALSDAMQNEISKAQKRYKDVYRAYKKKEALGDYSGDLSDELSKLNITTNGDKKKKLEVSDDPHKNFGFTFDSNGTQVYNNGLGKVYSVDNISAGDRLRLGTRLPNEANNGSMVEIDGNTYIYSTANGGTWYRITGQQHRTTKDGKEVIFYLPY